MIEPADAGRALARFHDKAPLDGVPVQPLAAYAETPRIEEWSLRSALVRYAQPFPVRAAAVLSLARRLDAALRPHLRMLGKDPVVTSRDLGASSFTTQGTIATADHVLDSAVTDLARLLVRWPDDGAAAVEGYREARAIDDALLVPLDMLTVAVRFDELADVLAHWAVTAAGPAPTAEVDDQCSAIYARMEALDIARETVPEGFRGRRG